MPVHELLERLKGVRKQGKGWSARCPAHDDQTPSLSVTTGDDGRILLHCHAGCEAASVLSALGLTFADVSPAAQSKSPSESRKPDRQYFDSADAAESRVVGRLASGKNQLSCTGRWSYHDADGIESIRVLRFDAVNGGKEFRPISRSGSRWYIGAYGANRVLYRRPSLTDAPVVLVAEGEKATDALVSVGFVATTSLGGANGARQSDWDVLAGRNVVIFPDNDEPGDSYAESVRELLLGLQPPAFVRVVRLPGLAEHGDALDFIEERQARGLTAEQIRGEIQDLINKAEFASDDEVVAAPSTLEFQPFPLDALPAAARRYVTTVAASIGCDPAFVAMPVLAASAAAIGNSTRIQLKQGWTEPSVIWVGNSGISGQQKSPAQDLIVDLVDEYQSEDLLRGELARQQFDADMARYERDFGEWKRSKSPGDPPVKPTEPIIPRRLCSHATIEAVADVLQHQPRGLLLAFDELAAWVKGFNQYRGGQGADAALWLQIHGARLLLSDRKSTKQRTIRIPMAAASVVGAIQPAVLRAVLAGEHTHNGFAARLLVASPPRRLKQWSEVEVSAETTGIVDRLLRKLYAIPLILDPSGKPIPRILHLDPDAKQQWVRFYNEHGIEQFGLEDALAAAWSKLEAYCARFALIIHEIRRVTGERVEELRVDQHTMECAIAITRWFANETRRCHTILNESEQGRQQRERVHAIRARGGSMTVREWQQQRSLPTSKKAEAELEELVMSGHARWQYSKPPSKGGRPSKSIVLRQATPENKTPTGSPAAGVLSVSDLDAGRYRGDREVAEDDVLREGLSATKEGTAAPDLSAANRQGGHSDHHELGAPDDPGPPPSEPAEFQTPTRELCVIE